LLDKTAIRAGAVRGYVPPKPADLWVGTKSSPSIGVSLARTDPAGSPREHR